MNKSIIFIIFKTWSLLILLLSFFYLGHVLYTADHKIFHIVTKIPVTSSWESLIIKQIFDWILVEFHQIIHLFNKFQYIPFVLAMSLIFLSIILKIMELSAIKTWLFFRILSGFALPIALSTLWYAFTPHNSDIVFYVKDLFTVVKGASLEEKRILFAAIYTQAFTEALMLKFPDLPIQPFLDACLPNKLIRFTDHWWFSTSEAEIRLKAISYANIDANLVVNEINMKYFMERIWWNLGWKRIGVGLISLGVLGLFIIYGLTPPPSSGGDFKQEFYNTYEAAKTAISYGFGQTLSEIATVKNTITLLKEENQSLTNTLIDLQNTSMVQASSIDAIKEAIGI